MTVIGYRLDFKFFLPLDQVRGWPRVVGPVLARFSIRGQQVRVEHVVDGPGWWKSESISNG